MNQRGNPEAWPYFQRWLPVRKRRNRLDHWQQGESPITVTWRLGDSLPTHVLREMRHQRAMWLEHHPFPWTVEVEMAYDRLFRQRIDGWLDRGIGSCLLRSSEIGRIVLEAVRYFDGVRCRIGSAVVMPNHVHVLFQPVDPWSLESLLKSWKGYSARQVNRALLRSGSLWADDYWDRIIRDGEHLRREQEYIRRNPEKARLRAQEFQFYATGEEFPAVG